MQLQFEDRIRTLNSENTSGQYVMYWMRTAVRLDHNPALVTALELAEKLSYPFFIYHALSESYPFASR